MTFPAAKQRTAALHSPYDLRSETHRLLGTARWRHYECAKQEWIEQHPHATPGAYEEAVKRIAAEFGI